MRYLFLFLMLLGFSSCKRYKVSSPSMSDTYKVGDIVMASSSDNIERNNVVFFKHTVKDKEETWMYRVIGLPGDKVEVRMGKVFVNGKEFDSPTTIRQTYLVHTTAELNKKSIEGLEHGVLKENEYIFNITKAQRDELAKNSAVKGIEDDFTPQGVWEDYIFMADTINNWNIDNFGPVEVPTQPEPSYFLMGDNRHNAMDSRFIGFVKKSSIVAVAK